ncbi:hypothetical protein [Methanolobus psychrotolerans]|uniref:hypothetical protein n=1 Tax=Methanolobus psychrotolerans TaxID=1874706 RepID=UPI00101AE161|nr:hypothetical protein [Methanolobus psychrotolerans]
MGAYNLEPAIGDLFWDFDDMEVLDIGKDNAVVFVKDVSRKNDEYYLHDSHELGDTVDILTIVYPDGSSRTILDASETPDTFYN